MKLNKILLSIFIILFASAAFALGGSEHAALWNEIFGIADKKSQDAIQPLWYEAQSVIDNYRDDYRDLQKRFNWFTWGSYGHRLLFHWGFNADPKNYSQLKSQVDKCLAKRDDKLEQSKEFFNYLTRNIQARRNRRLINAIVKTTGVPTSRGYANALASIIYDVHLLGDYKTPASSALPKIADIEQDLIQNGFRRLLTGGDKTERLNKIENELNAAVRAGRGRTDNRRAENLLNAAKSILPQILSERFKNTFAKHSIIINN